jgi:hypothetical protein
MYPGRQVLLLEADARPPQLSLVEAAKKPLPAVAAR